MNKLSEREYELVLAIVKHDYRCSSFFERLEEVTGMSWLDSVFSESNEQTFEELLDVLGVPKNEDSEDGYCREWIGFLLLDTFQKENNLTIDQKAKVFLDKFIEQLKKEGTMNG